METEKIERRNEKFQAANDPYGAVVGVANTAHSNNSVYVSIQRGAYGCGVSLTPDEADQLAEMLRLSARGLRGEGSMRIALQNVLAIAEIAEFYLPGELAESAERVHADIASAKNILNGVSKS